MKSKSKGKKSVIPARLQIPLTIVLGLVFVLVLSARLRGRGTAAQEAADLAAGDSQVTADATAADSQHRVDALIDKISEEAPEHEQERETGSVPVLPVDPFADPYGPPVRTAAGTAASRQRAQDEQDEEARASFVEGLTLQATLIDGEDKFAFIDDTLFYKNDTIGAFRIVAIGERAALLDDGNGPVLLEMKGDDLL